VIAPVCHRLPAGAPSPRRTQAGSLCHTGGRAYAHARFRARKSHLLGLREALPLLAATDAASLRNAAAALGVSPAKSFETLMSLYALALRTYDAPIFRALLGLHEIENLKLVRRVIVNHRDRAAIARLWRPLGSLSTIDAIRDATTLHELIERLARTPYADVARQSLRADADAELILDRWASQRLFDAIPPREPHVRQMIESIVRERDEQLVRRVKTFGISVPRLGAQASSPATARRPASPNGVTPPAETAGGCRRDACAPYRGTDPFSLAPAVAIILLAEAEVRAVRALIERGGDVTLDAVTARAMAGSLMGG